MKKQSEADGRRTRLCDQHFGASVEAVAIGIAPTVAALVALNRDTLDADAIDETLGVVLKAETYRPGKGTPTVTGSY